ncbi:FecR domain-containing protein [Candidatus Pelagibacter sp.]|nr:FecR domain-containing protein [Candidatus Pelagibacter sp.]
MKKNNVFHMRYIIKPIKKIYVLLYYFFLFFLILINKTYAEEKIGYIVSIKNDVYAINIDGEKRLLDLYDEILLQDEILTDEISSTTVQYNDNSTVIIKKSSSFKVIEFNIKGLKDIFLSKVDKGSVIIESGKIAKNDNGSMIVELPQMKLEIKGTRFNINNNIDGTSEISLAEDSFGKVGTINISSGGKLKTLFNPEQVISVNLETGISERPRTELEKNEIINASDELIEASSIDENLIQKKLEEKLLNGNLLDVNNDGKIDLSDVEIIKENIKIDKQEKLDFIVDNSTGENTEFLSQVLNSSDQISIGQSMDKIFETNNELVFGVMTDLANNDNQFITTSELEVNNVIKEKIFNKMLENPNDDNININLIGDIISRSDSTTSQKMINFITLSDTNSENSNVSLQVLSSITDTRSENSITFDEEKQIQVNRLFDKAIAAAGNSKENSMMLANIMTKSDEDTIVVIVDNISLIAANSPDSNFSLTILSSIADVRLENSINLDDEKQIQVNRLIEGAVATAGNSKENTMMLANVISKSNPDTISKIVNNIQITDRASPNTNLSLQVLSSVADVSTQNAVYLQDNKQTQVNRLIEGAVATADNNEDNTMMLANVMSKSNFDTISKMVDNIKIYDDQSALRGGNNNKNSSLSLQILSSVSDNNFENGLTFQSSQQTQVNRLIENVMTSAGNNAEDSKLLANVMNKSDVSTVSLILDNIVTTSATNQNSTFAAEVLSSFAITAADSTTSINTELTDRVNFFIDTVTNTVAVKAAAATEAAATEAAATEAAATEATEAAATEATEAAATEAAATAATEATEAAATEAAATEAAEEAATEAAATEAAEEATVTYNAQGFSTTSPFKHENGTSFNSDGRDYQGYNEAGYNSEGYSSGSSPIYNPDYDVSPA